MNNQSQPHGSERIERGIYRVNYPSAKGYRAYFKFKGVEYQKIFSTSTYGRKGLAAARKWRKEKMLEAHSHPDAQNPLKKKMKNNTSGVTGVRRGKVAWSATWVEHGKQQHRSFAFEKYGEEEAFKRACWTRAEAEKRLYGAIFQPELQNLTAPDESS